MNEQSAFPLLSWPGKPGREELDALRDSAGLSLDSYLLDLYGPLAGQWAEAFFNKGAASHSLPAARSPSAAPCLATASSQVTASSLATASCLAASSSRAVASSRAAAPGLPPPTIPPLPGLLVQGDNLALLGLLRCGPLRDALDAQGGIKLAYIDPPFAVGSDFMMPVHAGDAPPLKALAYSDVWRDGLCGYLSMLYARLALIKDVLAPNGSIVVHCDWRTAPHLRLVLDELFGSGCFLGDIVWHYTGGGRASRWFSRKHDRLLHYAVSDSWIFHADAVRVPYKPDSGYAKSGITSKSGKKYLPNPLGTPVDDVWDIPMINPLAAERCGYPTQKPAPLMERILLALSGPGDLVADFFCGSGSFPLAAAKLGRSWIACDSSPLAMLACQKRLAAQAEEQSTGQYIFARAPRPATRQTARQTTRQTARQDAHSCAKPTAKPAARPPKTAARPPKTASPKDCASHFSATLSGAQFSYCLTALDLAVDAEKNSLCVSLKRLVFTTHGADAPAALAGTESDWQQWLAAWSVALLLPDESSARILWSCHRRKASPLPAASPRLALDQYSSYIDHAPAFAVTLTDIFGNRTRVRLSPLPGGGFSQELQPEIL